jgi:hypothetical protein
LYDPATGTFAATGSLISGRGLHTATLLPNGKVLIAGGFGGDVSQTTFSSAELYDPATGLFTATTGGMIGARQLHAATLLGNGQVLITGGYNGGPLNSAELYDHSTDRFTATAGPMLTSRYHFTATCLPSGKVLIAAGQFVTPVPGGYKANSYLAQAELYDPALGTFTTTGPLNAARAGQGATLLPDGKVLMTGGFNAGTVVESYDPATGLFTAAGDLKLPRNYVTATLLPNGKVFINGSVIYGELYDPQ